MDQVEEKRLLISRLINGSVFFLLCCAFIFSTVYFGGVTPGATLIINYIAFLMGLFWLMRVAIVHEIVLKRSATFTVMALFVLVACISHFYSIHQYVNQAALIRLMPHLIIFGVIAHTFSREDMYKFFRLALVLALCVALFGIISYSLRRYDLFLYTKMYYLDRLTATFINPNHCACFINLMIPLAIYFCMTASKQKERIFYISVACILMIGVLLTYSHSGLLALSVALMWFLFAGFKYKILSRRVIGIIFISILGLLLAATFLSENIMLLLKRLYAGKLFSYVAHLSLLKGILALMEFTGQEAPLRLVFGYGFGSFKYVYNMFHPVLSLRYFEHAHNDFFEILIELGCIGLLLFGSIWYCGVRIVQKSLRQQANNWRLFYLCLGSSLWTFVINMVLNFNFNIMANTIFAFCIIGSLEQLKESFTIRAGRKVIFVFFGSFIFLIYFIFTTYSSISFLLMGQGREAAQQDDFRSSADFFDTAIALDKNNADAYYEYSEMLYYQAVNERNRLRRDILLDQSVHYMQRAAALNQYDARYYARLGAIHAFKRDFKQAEINYQKAVELMPNIFVPRWQKISFHLSNVYRQYRKAIEEMRTLLNEIHRYTFQDKKEKNEILRVMLTGLSKIPPSREVSRMREAILNELESPEFT